MCVQALVSCSSLLTDQLIILAVSGFPGFVKHSCPYTWGELFCVKEEVSASLWGILLTGQQVQDSLTCCLHQLCECVCVHMVCVGECVYVYEHGETKWQTARALGKLTDPAKLLVTLVNQKPADCCLSHFFSWKSCLFPVGYWRQRVCFSGGFFFVCFFLKWKKAL